MRRTRARIRAYWHAARRAADAAPAGKKGPDDVDRNDNGTDVYISLVDPNFRPSAPANWTLEVETTCLNRDLPQKLPFGGDQPRLRMREGGTAVSRITCLTPPTRTLRPPLGGRAALAARLPPHAQPLLAGRRQGRGPARDPQALRLRRLGRDAQADRGRPAGRQPSGRRQRPVRGPDLLLPGARGQHPVRRGPLLEGFPVPLRQRAGTLRRPVLHREFLLEADRHRQGAGRGVTPMAAEDRGEGPGLSRDLFDAPYRFDFFQAVRILEHRRRERERRRARAGAGPVRAARPGRPRRPRRTSSSASAPSPRSASPRGPSPASSRRRATGATGGPPRRARWSSASSA